jgi:hypothetical protein
VFDKKLQAIKDRSGMNIKSGRVMIEVKDRDWLFATIENFSMKIMQIEKELVMIKKAEMSTEEYEFYERTLELFNTYFPRWNEQ